MDSRAEHVYLPNNLDLDHDGVKNIVYQLRLFSVSCRDHVEVDVAKFSRDSAGWERRRDSPDRWDYFWPGLSLGPVGRKLPLLLGEVDGGRTKQLSLSSCGGGGLGFSLDPVDIFPGEVIGSRTKQRWLSSCR